jgi:hypothetical protein
MKIGRLFLGVVGSVLITTGALAADPLPGAPTASPQIARPGAFDWSGLYVGVYTSTNGPVIGTLVGYSVLRGRLLFGLEGGAGTASGFGMVNLRARLGATIRPRLLGYYATGVIWVPVLSQAALELGGGLEFAIADDVSLYAEAMAIHPFGIPLWALNFQAGVKWYP